MPTTRNITGLLRGPTGVPLTDARITFELVGTGFAVDGQYPPRTTLATTDSNGEFTVSLWPNDLGDSETRYACKLPSGEIFEFILPEGDGSPITLTEAHALGLINIDWYEQRIGLLAAQNLADVPDKPQALDNLGVTAAIAAHNANTSAHGQTAAGRALLTAADATAQRAALSVESSTQLDARDTANRDRANHTGTQLASTISDFATAADARITAQKAQPSGLASLDAGGKLPAAQLPDLAVSDYLGSVANQSAMLALVGQRGDWCTRSDLGTNFAITGADPTQLSSWTQLNYPTAPVTSVAGKTGAVTLVVGDVSGAVSTTRTLNATAPLRIDGGGSANLSADRTLSVNAATDAAAGVVELATPTEVATGTDTTRAVTPAGSKAALDAREALVLEWLASREAAGYLWCDGTTAHRGAYSTGPRSNAAGVPAWGLWGKLPVPTASSTAEIYTQASATSATAISQAWSHGLAWAGNDLVYFTNGATPASDFRRATWSGLRTTYSGQEPVIDLRVTGGSATAPTLRVNGAVVVPTITDGAGTDPDWLSASLVCTNTVRAYLYPTGVAFALVAILGHLTDAESETWRITGRRPFWVTWGGGADNIILSPSRNSDFSAGATDWTTQFGATATVVAGSLVCATSNALANVRLPSNFLARPIVGGSRPRLVFTVSGFSTTGGQLLASNAHQSSETYVQITGDGQYSAALTSISTSASAVPQFLQTGAGSFDFTLDDVRIVFEGALSLPDILPIAALGDGTMLGDNPARLVGIRPVTTRKDWQITARTATSGNEQILGGSFLDTTRDVLDSIEQTPESGPPTTTVGSASGGAQYKASGALTAGINTPALVTRKTASANVWVGSSTADPVRTTITGHSR